MKKLLLILLMMMTSAAAGWWIGSGKNQPPAPPPTPAPVTYHAGPSIEQVRALASLVTARVDVADAQVTQLAGVAGSIRACILVKGDFLLGTDLSQARFDQVDSQNCTAVLVLPQPQVWQPRLDHDRTRIVGISESGLWQITPSDGATTAAVVNQAYADAQKYVSNACSDPALLVRARQQSEQVLWAFFNAMGWKVSIRWAD